MQVIILENWLREQMNKVNKFISQDSLLLLCDLTKWLTSLRMEMAKMQQDWYKYLTKVNL